MAKSDVGLLVWAWAFLVGAFAVFQTAGWRSDRAILGGTRRFAQFAMATCVVFTAVVALCLLLSTLNIRSATGPLALLYVLAVLSTFLMPALLVIEVILVAECTLTNRVERGACSWHLGALLGCGALAGLLVFTALLGYE